MAPRAFLVGGSGQIGRAVADALLAEGWDVTVGQRAESGSVPEGVRRQRLDRDDTAELRAAVDGADLVVDAVAFGPGHSEQYRGLDDAVGSLVVISTGSVYLGRNGTYFDIGRDESTYPVFDVPVHEENPTIDVDEPSYGPQKAAMERGFLAQPKLRPSILRPAAVHGPGSTRLREWYFIKRALDARPHVVLSRSGRSRFATSSTLNIAALVLACARQPGVRTLNAVDEEGYNTAQITRIIFDTLGRTTEVVPLPGPPRGRLGQTPLDAAHDFVCSMDAARAIGYEPAVDYREAVRMDVEWALAEVEIATRRGGDWRDAFPQIVKRSGEPGWFDYEVEDAYVASLSSAGHGSGPE